MKPASSKVLVLLLWTFLEPVAASRSSEAVARAWLQAHQEPSRDGLDELKSTNPDAYAIVKSLLMKRQLGLLDPKHPRSSFTSAPVDEDAAAGAAPLDGPGAYQSLSSPVDAGSVEKPHHDWLSWRPQDTAANDQAMVNSVLGEVAELKGAKPAETVVNQVASTDAAPQLAADTRPVVSQQRNTYLEAIEGPPEKPKHKVFSDMVNSDSGAAQPAAAAAPHPKPKHENSYLKVFSDMDNIDSGAAQPAAAAEPHPKPKHVNSYLKAIGVSSVIAKGPRNYLANPASFSWDDEDPKLAKKAVATRRHALRAPMRAMPTDTMQAPHHDSSLLTWLGGSKISKAPRKRVHKKPTPKPQPENKYLADLE